MLLSPPSEATAEGQGTGNLSPPHHSCTLASGQAQPKFPLKGPTFLQVWFWRGIAEWGRNSLI